MKLGTLVQVVLIGLVLLLFVFEMLGALLSSPCTLTGSDEFIDPVTMFSSVCRVEMTCEEGAWSGEMGTTAGGGFGSARRSRRHRDCPDVGSVVRRSPLWGAPRVDGPIAGFKWSLFAVLGAALLVPVAGRLNPRERLSDRDPSRSRR